MMQQQGWLMIGEGAYIVPDSSMVKSAYDAWVEQYLGGIKADNTIPTVSFSARTVIVFKRITVDGAISDILATSYELPKNLCTVGEMNYTYDGDNLMQFSRLFNYVKLAPGLYIVNNPTVLDFVYADWLAHQVPRVGARMPVMVDLDDVEYPVMVSVHPFGGEHHIQTSQAEAAVISPGIYRIMSQQGLYQAYDHFNFGRPSIDKLPEGQGTNYAYPGIVDFTPNTKPIANWLPTQ